MARRRRGGVLSPAYFIRRASINKGLLGADRFWRTIFFIGFGRKVLKRLMNSEAETVALEKLEPGQFVRIEAIDPRTLDSGKKRRRK